MKSEDVTMTVTILNETGVKEKIHLLNLFFVTFHVY